MLSRLAVPAVALVILLAALSRLLDGYGRADESMRLTRRTPAVSDRFRRRRFRCMALVILDVLACAALVALVTVAVLSPHTA